MLLNGGDCTVLFLSMAKLKSIFFKEKYRKNIASKYDFYMKLLNDNECALPDLSIDAFQEFGIYTLEDLRKYLKKNAEYGGYVHVPWTKELVLIPFHNDFMNDWLRFDNPRVEHFYDKLYESVKDNYDSRIHFDMKRFDIEENLQLNNWRMPPIDKRMLSVPINGCWDKPELIAKFLELHGYQTKRLCCHDGHIMRGHCFTVYTDGVYWRTASSFPINLKCKDFKKMCYYIYRVLRHVPIYSDSSHCQLVEFEPPTPGMCTHDYLEKIRNGRVWITNH